jgi:hypothetical protein
VVVDNLRSEQGRTDTLELEEQGAHGTADSDCVSP